MVDEIPNGIHRSVKDQLLKRKIKIVEMEHEESGDLSEKRIIYRRSLVGKKEKGRDEDRISAFVVKGYETAILVQLGKTVGELSEGVYEIDKEFQYTGTEIIWINRTEFLTRWGAADIYLKDNIKIGARGSLIVKISAPKNFVLNVVAGKQIVERKQIDNFVFNLVVQTHKEILQEFTIDEVIRSREAVKSKAQAKLFDLLTHWGLELVTLEIEGFNLPKEFEKLGEITMESKVAKAGMLHAKDTDILKTEVELEKEKAKIKSKAELTKEERAIMKEEIETLRLKREYEAAHRDIEGDKRGFERQQGMLESQTGFDKAKYDAGAKQIHGTVDVDLEEKKSVAKIAGAEKVKIAEIEANRDVKKAELGQKDKDKKEEKEKGIKSQIKELKEKMDKFDEMLAEGKISDDIYKMRVSRIEKELKDLESKLTD